MELDKTKKYDLSQLNDEQLQDVKEYLVKNDRGWDLDFDIKEFVNRAPCIEYDDDFGWDWISEYKNKGSVNALELFENELQNQYSECYGKDETNIYDDILSLIEKGKQHGLKIVVTFEKL